MQAFKIFIASPGDVDDERTYAIEVIHQLNNEPLFRDVVKIQAIGWDQPGMSVAMAVGRTPQESIAMGMTQPKDCDLVLVLLWAKMGTPLPESHLKPDGSRYWSGTEWEYCNALESYRKHGRPEIWIYHRQGAPHIPLNDPQIDERRTQWQRLVNFLAPTRNTDGSINDGLNPYQQPLDFRRLFEQNLRTYLTAWLQRQHSEAEQQAITDKVGTPLIRVIKQDQDETIPLRGLTYLAPDNGSGLETTQPRATLVQRGDQRLYMESKQDEIGPWCAFEFAEQRLLFRYIQAGEYQQGSPTSEPERRSDEGPRRVKISRGFWISETPVTQAFWKALMGSNPSEFRNDSQPVEQVSWHQAQEFMQVMRQTFEYVFRLPTEAEWEYACRAGSRGPFYTGAQITTSQANYDGHFPYDDGPRGVRHKHPVAVKSYPANAWGLYDMHGNVWEWCEDWYDEYICNDDKTAISDPEGPSEGREKVARGGSWLSEAGQCRSAKRMSAIPNHGHDEFGFRVVMLDE